MKSLDFRIKESLTAFSLLLIRIVIIYLYIKLLI